MKHVLGFSGGIDSQAVARWLLNRYPAEDCIFLNSTAGGNEHELTKEFVARYNAEIHEVIHVEAHISDMWVGADEPAKHGYNSATVLTFDTMAEIKGRFPARRSQFCTKILKVDPMVRWIKANLQQGDYEAYTGVRRDESENRRNTPFREWDELYDTYRNNVIADWSKAMCFEFVKAHGEPINPLYMMGFSRVGCMPCVNWGKDDILTMEARSPDSIDKIRSWENRVGRTFFGPMVPGMAINWIDDVIAWAKTDRGGRQSNMFRTLNERPNCESKYGLCE